MELKGFELTAALAGMCWVGFIVLVLLGCQAPVLAMGLVRGLILNLLLAVVFLLSLCCAWGHLDDSPGDTLGLAGGQGIAAVSVLLELQCELQLREL